ncbi:MAG: RsbRD N-terminal domain-containing protein [Nitrospirota bacterium]|nr:MAG: RsbRD N-terminal domain-containing protein [Nitrospirota bacterium]
MTLNDLLSEKGSAIKKKWFDAVIETYPPETSKFFGGNKSEFRNPVGDTINKAVEGIFDQLINDKEPLTGSDVLDQIIRVRAIQDFSPSEAVRFIFLLKDIIRGTLIDAVRKNGLFDELLGLEARIDELACLSFDIFMSCREKLYEIKATELHRWTYKIIENANVLKENPDSN